MVVGEKLAVDAGFANAEYRLITAVGTAGAGGTGITLDSALSRRAREWHADPGRRQRHHAELGAVERPSRDARG